ncbi:hypothetical protein Tco_0345097 [Tanacetum coccineum]
MMESSEMLPEVLDIIAQKYITCYEDYPSFAGLCKSWRLAAARTYHNSNGPPSRFPSLMLAKQSDNHDSCELFLLSNKSIRKIRLPEAYGKACRSSCGWLLTVAKDSASQLTNPLSCEIINLPKVDTFTEATHPSYLYGPVQKVVLFMESKLVFVIWDYNKLRFCHIGDNKWTSVEESYDDFILDITFYNRQIQACNVNRKDRAVLVDVTMAPEYVDVNYRAYIVGLDDGERKQLLLIIEKGINYKTNSFQVLAYDLESGNWSKVKDFGKKTVFVGYTSSFWVEDTTGVTAYTTQMVSGEIWGFTIC